VFATIQVDEIAEPLHQQDSKTKKAAHQAAFFVSVFEYHCVDDTGILLSLHMR
jgi:hypothetical protein